MFFAKSPAVSREVSGDTSQPPKPRASLLMDGYGLPIRNYVQKSPEEELSESYSMLEASFSRSPKMKTQPRQDFGISQGEEYSHYEKDTFLILHSACYPSNPYQRQDEQDAAGALADRIVKVVDPTLFIRATIQSMRRCARERPQSIDCLLRVFAQASKLLPDTVNTEYGPGKAAGRNILQLSLQEEATGLVGPGKRCDVAVQDTTEGQKLESSHRSLRLSLGDVLRQVEDGKRARTSYLIKVAMYGRAFATSLLRMKDGGQMEALIASGLCSRRTRGPRMGEISACILIQACGQAVLDSSGGGEEGGTECRRGSWRGALEDLLLQESEEDCCFGVKVHANVRRPCKSCSSHFHLSLAETRLFQQASIYCLP